MGIKNLNKFIAEKAPGAIRKTSIEKYATKKIAIDANMCIYQFLYGIRSMTTDGEHALMAHLSHKNSVTAHLVGLFYRTLKFLENNINVVYVFDGKPPEMKNKELNKRVERRKTAAEHYANALDNGDDDTANKMSTRMVKVTSEHVRECKELLALMGIPFIDAPSEAEAQCAALAKSGLVDAVYTEDMDALAFGCPVLIRNLVKAPVEYDTKTILKALNLDQKLFVDLCILMGCDYCG